MRRSARVLSATALAGVALGVTASAASADPGAEISPGSVTPGGSVTVSVRCDAVDGTPPDFIDARSEGFEDGTVRLERVEAEAGATGTGPSYLGTARVPAAADGSAQSVPADGTTDGLPADDGAQSVPADPQAPRAVDGSCPGGSDGRERPWSASFTVTRHDDGVARGDAMADPSGGGTRYGVRAGDGGAFTPSVPTLVAGGVLVAGALGGAAYRLRYRAGAAGR
ncbi:hypothetical protein OK074_2763 [Actinobacteria bacterium OK074]|nr:hypothetical protein OK074_2763 [Actinobacteria bacterium OK074]